MTVFNGRLEKEPVQFSSCQANVFGASFLFSCWEKMLDFMWQREIFSATTLRGINIQSVAPSGRSHYAQPWTVFRKELLHRFRFDFQPSYLLYHAAVRGEPFFSIRWTANASDLIIWQTACYNTKTGATMPQYTPADHLPSFPRSFSPHLHSSIHRSHLFFSVAPRSWNESPATVTILQVSYYPSLLSLNKRASYPSCPFSLARALFMAHFIHSMGLTPVFL